MNRYESVYADGLPEQVTGQEFVDMYGSHNDPVTRIDPKQQYAVKAPASHPIYEKFRVEVRSFGRGMQGKCCTMAVRLAFSKRLPDACWMSLKAFSALLSSASGDEQLTTLGELMYQVIALEPPPLSGRLERQH